MVNSSLGVIETFTSSTIGVTHLMASVFDMVTPRSLFSPSACGSVCALFVLTACSDAQNPSSSDDTSGSTGSTGTSAGSVASSETGSTGPGTGEESSTSTSTGSSSSGSETETGSTTEEMDSVCGNGVVEEGEGCDEEGAIDEDGCNVDCTVSGSLLWSWEPEREVILRVDFNDDDVLHALIGDFDGALSVRRFDASGDVTETFEVSPHAFTPPGAPDEDPNLDLFDLEATGDEIYVGTLWYWQADGEFFVTGQVERLGEDGWIRELDAGTQAIGPRPHGGVFAYSIDDVLYAFDADGVEDWSVQTDLSLRLSPIAIDDAVVVVAADRVVAFDDASGEELWSFVEPKLGPELVFHRISRSANEIWLDTGQFPVTDDDSFFRLGFDGALLEHIETSSTGFWHEMTPSGNLVWMREQDSTQPILIEKLDANLDVLWAHEFQTDEGWRNLAVDERGTVAAAKSRALRVLAP